MKINKNQVKAIFQIAILVIAIFAFADFYAEFFDEGNLVSAAEGTDPLASLQEIGIDPGMLLEGTPFGRIFSKLQNIGLDPNAALQKISEISGGGVSVCLETKEQGKKCQIMQNKQCEEVCLDGQCVQVASSPSQGLTNIPDECRLGTCLDREEGICLPNSPKGECDSYGEDKAKWFDDPNGNVEECLKACCVLGSEVQFTTQLQCQRIAESYGLEFPSDSAKFNSELNSEIDCKLFAVRGVKGACTFTIAEQDKKECRFVGREECENLGGNFEEEKLCSHPDLNTICAAKNHTACVDGLEEVYWFDSCGNVENIYGTDETGKQGMVIPKYGSCEIGEPGNLLKNQETCGNCNQLLSSVCGEEIEEQELDDSPDGGVVCRDLGCDDEGVRREHGETWCAYQTDFGLPLDVETPGSSLMQFIPGGIGFLGGIINGRSIGPPGSQFFRKSCINGNVTLEACQDGRRAICVETKEEINGTNQEISVASCRLNRWVECLNYNPTSEGGGSQFDAIIGKIEAQIAMTKCEADPDCFVKTVNVDKDFQFPICLAKYPPGFSLGNDGGGGEAVCGYASQTCQAVFVKEAVAGGFGGGVWKCTANCGCVTGNDPDTAQPSMKFVSEMSDFCTSLGDCGLKINYLGAPGGSGGFSLKKCVTEEIEGECKRKMPVFSLSSLLGTLINPATQMGDIQPKPGKYIDASDIEAFSRSLGASTEGAGSVLSALFGLDDGGDEGIGLQVPGVKDPGLYSGTELPYIASVPGAGALGLAGAAKIGLIPSAVSTTGATFATEAGASAAFDAAIQGGATTASQGITEGGLFEVVSTTSVMNPAIQGVSQGLTAAAIAAAAAGILISVTGIGRGLGPGWSYAYMGTAAVGGAIVGLTSTTPGVIVLYELGIHTLIPFLEVLGPIILIIAFTMILLNFAFGVGSVKKVEVTAECKQWQPPVGVGSETCNKCGQDGFPCNEYACSSLGASCQLVGEHPNVVCEDMSPDDVSAPVISEFEEALEENFEITLSSESGFAIRKTGGNSGCLEDFESATIGIETDEYAWCKFSLDSEAEFEDMNDFGTNSLKKEHVYGVSSLDIVNYFNDIGEPLTEEEEVDVSLFVKCQDAKGNINSRNYVINLCIIRADWTAPFLTYISERGGYLPYGAEEETIVVRSNEPVEMRWSFQDKDFDEMENSFVCPVSESVTDCWAEIPIERDNVVIYVRAKDHAEWAGTEREEDRNENQESLVVSLERTESALAIDSLVPEDGAVIFTNLPVVTVDIEARVSGGQSETISCYIGQGRIDAMNLESPGVYKKSYDRFRPGEHILRIECEDEVGNSAVKESSFKIVEDTTPTTIARVYDDFGTLVVITREEATCSFSNENCHFDVEDGELMEGTELVHRTGFDGEKTYYIKCKDAFGNEKSDCDIVAAGGLF
ncbi:MAG: hypothetical protein KJ600_01595 [Nanoarchaeota archaeon]|nr:hypothetical protein [Nanoarchaeota archaeon]MBU1103233.1 hypothetical protein [Nanoarchaeota archaeon]